MPAVTDDDDPPPSLLGGFRALLVGAVGFFILWQVLQPITEPEDCPNYGGSGSGSTSAFSDPAWSFYLPMLLFGWIVLVILEQVLPSTWDYRSRWIGALRATAAILIVLVASCFIGVPPLLVCG